MIFALLLNEIKNVAFKRCIQTVVYLPHFISWVIMGGILLDVFGLYGPINMVLSAFGMEPIAFFRISKLFRTLAIGTDVWKEFGFNAVVWRPSPASALPYMRRQPLMGQGAGAGCGTSRCRDSSR